MNDEKLTATEVLRQLLDERGVEWKASKAPLPVTSWHGAHGFKFTAMNPYGVTDYLLVQTNTLDEWPHLTPEQAVAATLGTRKQPPYEELIEALRRDWDIEASWDGLRRFWYVGLTDEGVRKRDEREATLGRGTCKECAESMGEYADSLCDPFKAENDKLRELCRHLYTCNQYCDREESDGGCSACPYQLLECDCGFEERLLELGMEVES